VSPRQKRGKGSGSAAPLTKESVIKAAMDLADEVGAASLTMRKLADKLGVEAMSLYYHVANKDAILDGLLDSIYDEIELPSPGRPWKAEMRNRAFSAREVVLRHKWAVSLMDSQSNPGPPTIRYHNAALGTLRSDGFSIPMAAHAVSAIDAYTYGFVMQEEALPFDTEEELKMLADMMLQQFPEREYPYFAELVTKHALKPGYSYKDEFEFGLDLILDGLEQAISSPLETGS
jgi:AcrR family transcriptional regulator